MLSTEEEKITNMSSPTTTSRNEGMQSNSIFNDPAGIHQSSSGGTSDNAKNENHVSNKQEQEWEI